MMDRDSPFPGPTVIRPHSDKFRRQTMAWLLSVQWLGSLTLFAMLWPAVNHVALISWVAGVWLISGLHGALLSVRRPHSARPDLLPGSFFIALPLLEGSLWGLAGVYLALPGVPPLQFHPVWMAGIIAHAVIPLQALAGGAAWAFALTSLVPLVAQGLVSGHLPWQAAAALLVAMVAMLRVTRWLAQTVQEQSDSDRAGSARDQAMQSLRDQLDAESGIRQEAERLAGESIRRAHILADAPFEGIVVHESGIVLDANRTLLEMLGLTPEQAIGHSISDFVSAATRSAIERELHHPTGLPFETVAVRSDGVHLPVEVRGRDFPYQGRTVRVVSIRDISYRKDAESRLQHVSSFDLLTGLANRAQLRERLGGLLERAHVDHRILGLLTLELDNFRSINDSLGYRYGDRLLQHVAGRIREGMRTDDMVARVGTDAFAVILADVSGAEDAAQVAQRLVDDFNRPFNLDEHEVFSPARAGIALYPDDGRDADTLIRNANMALNQARETGQTCQFFTAEISVQVARRFEIEAGLRRGLDRGEFELHYQPKVALDSGKLLGVEALIRWRHPEKGIIPPLDFIPVAERTGLIEPIGAWVLEEACAMLRRREDQGHMRLPVAVNLSLRQLKQQDIVQRISELLQKYRLEPGMLEIEITESTLAEDAEIASRTLQAMHELGIPLSIDDFGTGYSSLSYLNRFPVDTLKLDRSFTRNIPASGHDVAIVNVVAAIADSFDLKVVAEGVETMQQLAFLQSCGCHAMQGFLVGRAIPESELRDWEGLWCQPILVNGLHPLFEGVARMREDGLRFQL